MSTKQKMQKAADLIRDKRYDEARRLLRSIDHPKAREWLNKLDERTAKGKKSPAKKASGGRRVLILLVGGLLLVGIAILASVLLGGSDDDPPSPTAISLGQSDGAAAPPETPIAAPTDVPPAEDTDAAANTAPPPDNIDVGGTGQRIQFMNGGSSLFTAELPQGWVCDCGLGQNRLEPAEGRSPFISAQFASRAFDPDYFLDKTLDETLAETLRDDEEIVEQTIEESNGREVLLAIIVETDDEDQEREFRYFVKDSDGHVIIIDIPSFADDPEQYQDGVLFIAGNIEGETDEAAFAFSDRLMSAMSGVDPETGRDYLLDQLDTQVQHLVALPEGWAMQSAGLGLPMAVKNGDPDTSATAFVRLSGFADPNLSISEIAQGYIDRNEEPVLNQETVQAGGRDIEIVRAVFDDSAQPPQESTYYYVVDSSGALIVLITQPYVPDPNSLRDDILQMAANVETRELTYAQLLGLAEDTQPAEAAP